MDREFGGGLVVPFPVSVAPTVEPGLTLPAPAGGGSWPVGVSAGRSGPAAVSPQVVAVTYPDRQAPRWSVAREPVPSAGGQLAGGSVASADPGPAEGRPLDIVVVTPRGVTGAVALPMARGVTWPAGAYRITARFATKTLDVPFCVGG